MFLDIAVVTQLTNEYNLALKVSRVINSCVNREQLIVAKRYWDLSRTRTHAYTSRLQRQYYFKALSIGVQNDISRETS